MPYFQDRSKILSILRKKKGDKYKIEVLSEISKGSSYLVEGDLLTPLSYSLNTILFLTLSTNKELYFPKFKTLEVPIHELYAGGILLVKESDFPLYLGSATAPPFQKVLSGQKLSDVINEIETSASFTGDV